MIIATIRMTFSSKRIGDALEILRPVAERSKIQPGCLSCTTYRNSQNNNILMFQQLWTNEESLERHLRSEEYVQVLLVMEMAIKKPEIRFDTILSSTGIETIEKARSSTGRG